MKPFHKRIFFFLQSAGKCPFFGKSGRKMSKKGCPALLSKGDCSYLDKMKDCHYFKNIGTCPYIKKVCPFIRSGSCAFLGKVKL
jgi:hypothetical protein